jgi:hypothetical protein
VTTAADKEERIMKKWIVLGVLAGLIAGAAAADVSNEIVVGLEGDSTREAESSVNGAKADLNGKLEIKHALYGVRYTRFIEPLRDDGAAIDLRRFLQHPSSLTVALSAIGTASNDYRDPLAADEQSTIAMAVNLGGEMFFKTGTGIFLSFGGGSGTDERHLNGVKQPEMDVELGFLDLGVRQYVAPSVELHLALRSESITTRDTGTGTSEDTSKKNVLMLGGEGIIGNVVGLKLDIGGGSREVTHSSGMPTDKFDIARVNAEIALYAGKQWTFLLGVELESEEQTGLPSGFEQTTDTGRATLAARYWFSERFGLELPIHAETIEDTSVTPLAESKLTIRNSGAGLYAGFRF